MLEWIEKEVRQKLKDDGWPQWKIDYYFADEKRFQEECKIRAQQSKDMKSYSYWPGDKY